MQEMQAFLAERGINVHVDATRTEHTHSCKIIVFNDECEVVADVYWRSWRPEVFESDWAEFEAKVRESFFGWWE